MKIFQRRETFSSTKEEKLDEGEYDKGDPKMGAFVRNKIPQLTINFFWALLNEFFVEGAKLAYRVRGSSEWSQQKIYCVQIFPFFCCYFTLSSAGSENFQCFFTLHP